MFEPLEELHEVHEVAAQAVELVDGDHIHEAGVHVVQEPLEVRPCQRRARDPAVVVVLGEQRPADPAAAGDVAGDGLALRLDAAELLLGLLD